jgi:excisionase family DNA binding protein
MIICAINEFILYHRKEVNRMEAKEGLLKIGAVAERLGVSVPHTYRLAKTGELPCVRLGPKAIRFEEAAVERFIRAHRSGKGKAA